MQRFMNVLDEILQEVKNLNSRIEQLEKVRSSEPNRIPFPDFCKQREITRPTGYAWAEKKLIQTEKIGGRLYVLGDSITVQKKYQRREMV